MTVAALIFAIIGTLTGALIAAGSFHPFPPSAFAPVPSALPSHRRRAGIVLGLLMMVYFAGVLATGDWSWML